jgi:hypothetical protein
LVLLNSLRLVYTKLDDTPPPPPQKQESEATDLASDAKTAGAMVNAGQ